MKICNTLLEIPIFLIILLFAQNVRAEPSPPTPPTPPIVISPNGGEIWSGTHDVTWTASTDPDGDPITYEIEYSYDGGGTWHPLATGISETSYSWDTTTYPDSANYLIRVRAYEERKRRELYSDWDQSDGVFTIGNTAPTVVDHTPIGTDVPVTTIMTVTFSEAMDKTSVQKAFSISPSVPGSFSWSDNTLIFTPSSDLAYGTTYSVTIGTGSMDLASNHLQLPYNWQFSTPTSIVHDIAITSVTASPASVKVGESVSIAVATENEGTVAETFDVSVYYDTELIETRTGVSLDAGAIRTLKFAWAITGVAEGTYTIKVEASTVAEDEDPKDNTFTDGQVIVVAKARKKPPVASFTFSPIEPVEGEIVTFNASASYDPDGTIKSYMWDFGDGTSDSGMIVTHTYSVEGTYTATLTVTDDDGLTDFATADLTVSPPLVNDIAIIGVTVSSTSVEAGNPVSIKVTVVNQGDFSEIFNVTIYHESVAIDTRMDVSLGAESTTTLTFTWDTKGVATGTYTISAEASVVPDEIDTADNVFFDGEVAISPELRRGGGGNERPRANLTYSPSAPTDMDTIQFKDKSHDPDGSIVSWLWDFGDGSNSTEKNPTHQYADNGNYTVILTVRDNDGEQGEITKRITVLNVPPKADFTIISPPKLHQPTPQGIIEFEDRSSDPDGSIVSWYWEFGDGTISTDQNSTHKYEVLGTYIIKLVVTDVDGAIDVASKVYDPIPPMSINDYDGLWHTEEFAITLTATDDYSGVQAIYYETNDSPTKSVQADGQPHITAEGNNKLEYWSVDGAGNEEAHHIIDVKLDKTAPVANAGGDRSVAQNILATFDASESSDNVGVVSYEWDFGDGSKGTGLTTTHTYKEPGNYVVWLTVEDVAGNKNTNSVSVTVLKDTDSDGTPDATDIDDDGDGMPDTGELSYGLDPLDATDAALDPDGDGLTNLDEYRLGTDPLNYFSPFPWWIFVLVATFGTTFIITRYAITCVRYQRLLKKMERYYENQQTNA